MYSSRLETSFVAQCGSEKTVNPLPRLDPPELVTGTKQSTPDFCVDLSNSRTEAVMRVLKTISNLLGLKIKYRHKTGLFFAFWKRCPIPIDPDTINCFIDVFVCSMPRWHL